MEAVRQMYGEKIEYIEEMFINEEEKEDEMKKGKWNKWSESASTSPDHKRGMFYNAENSTPANECDFQGKSSEKASAEQTMTKDNPGFLKYLQLKVSELLKSNIIIRSMF